MQVIIFYLDTPKFLIKSDRNISDFPKEKNSYLIPIYAIGRLVGRRQADKRKHRFHST